MGRPSKKKGGKTVVLTSSSSNDNLAEVLEALDDRAKTQKSKKERAAKLVKKTRKNDREVSRVNKLEGTGSRLPESADCVSGRPAQRERKDGADSDASSTDFEVCGEECFIKDEITSDSECDGSDDVDNEGKESLEEEERKVDAKKEFSDKKTLEENGSEVHEEIPLVKVEDTPMVVIKREVYDIVEGHPETDLVTEIKVEVNAVEESYQEDEHNDGDNEMGESEQETCDDNSDIVSVITMASSDEVQTGSLRSLERTPVLGSRNAESQNPEDAKEDGQLRKSAKRMRISEGERTILPELRRPTDTSREGVYYKEMDREKNNMTRKNVEKESYKNQRKGHADLKSGGVLTRSKRQTEEIKNQYEIVKRVENLKLGDAKREQKESGLFGEECLIVKRIPSKKFETCKSKLYDLVQGRRDGWSCQMHGGFGVAGRIIEKYSKMAQDERCVISPGTQKPIGTEKYLRMMTTPEAMGLLRVWSLGLGQLMRECHEISMGIQGLNSVFGPRQTSGAMCAQINEIISAMGTDLGSGGYLEDQSAYFIASLFNIGTIGAAENSVVFGET